MIATDLVLPDGQTAADVVGAVVQAYDAAATVKLKEFWVTQDVGIFTSDALATISAEVTSRGRSRLITGKGRNQFGNLSPKNYAIAMDRALDEFTSELKRAFSE